MGKRLYVGNLPYDADEAGLRDAFGQDGRTVERVHIVLDRETQRPRGFAFVEMATEEQAKQAIEKMDGVVYGTRQLRVTEAEDRRPGGPGGAPRPDRAAAGGPSARPGAGQGGGYAGGVARPGGDDAMRNRFGPDARPKRERDQEPRRAPRRRTEGEAEDDRGRRGNRRFDDDEE